MHCHKDCKPPEWTETGMQLNPRTGQPQPGTGTAKLKKDTGCVYTREGSGCCLLPLSGAVQPSDMAQEKIAAKRRELLEKAIADGQMKPKEGDTSGGVW